ncbi:MAG: hypothetical protein K2K41_02985, partial [Ruminiclostridium sp.]|nr:hypothetical protein [Ruminiclostridium sp.]
MNGINTSINNAINRYRQANSGFRPTAFNTKSQIQQASSKETVEAWKRNFDGFERISQTYGNSNQNYNKSNSAQSKSSWENVRKYDGFDPTYGTIANYKTHKPSNTDKVEFYPAGSEESKKAKELSDAYAYFRRAAKSNGYTVVQSGTENSLYSYAIMSGKKSVIMIDPEFMNTIKDDPEMLKKYADEIETMKKLDKQFERSCKQQGKKIISRGWKIEKDGSISS